MTKQMSQAEADATHYRAAQLTAMEQALRDHDLDRLSKIIDAAESHLRAVFRRRLGSAASLAARELVRYAERYLILGLRQAQDEGRIETTREASVRTLMESRGLTAPSSGKVKVKDVLPGAAQLYPLGDAPLARFEAAIAAGKDRGRLGRADLIKELNRLAAEEDARRPEELRGRRRLDVNQVIEAAIAASGIAEEVETQLDWSKLDPARSEEFFLGLREVINSLNRVCARVERRRSSATFGRRNKT